MNREARATIESSIKENDSHRQKIERVVTLLEDLFPTDVEHFKEFSEEQIEHVDQLIYRFSKMQDSLGMRLIPAIYSWLEEDAKPKPFIDVLNRLEKLSVIDSVEKWQYFRNLRNNLAHDYPESIAQTVETLNLLHKEINDFLNIYKQLKQTWLNRTDEKE